MPCPAPSACRAASPLQDATSPAFKGGLAVKLPRSPGNRGICNDLQAPGIIARHLVPELTGKYRPRRSSRPADSMESATICKQALSFPPLRSGHDAVPPAPVTGCCPPVVRLVIFASPADPAALQNASRASFANNFHRLDPSPPLRQHCRPLPRFIFVDIYNRACRSRCKAT
jgi:hypothetical protein